MRIPSHNTTSQTIEIATADTVAAKLPFQVRLSGGWYRTQAICHGGDAPDSLAFRNSDREGGELRVHCHSGNCDPVTIRHAIQEVTGLQVCRCDDCWSAWRAGEPRRAAQAARDSRKRRKGIPPPPSSPKEAATGPQQHRSGDTAAYAAQMWTAAAVSTGRAPEHHPVSRWLAHRGLWAAGELRKRSQVKIL